MPERVDQPDWKALFDALGKTCYYRIDNSDDPKWVLVYITEIDVGFDKYVKVIPEDGTLLPDQWYQENKPSYAWFPNVVNGLQLAPIKVTDLSRIRI